MSRVTEPLQSRIRVGPQSTVLRERRFYQNIYLSNDDGKVTAFITDAAEVRGPSGRVQLRTVNDVIDFDNSEDLVTAIIDGQWLERPDDRSWKPQLSQLLETVCRP